ncbi:amino acid/polyamine/organocation transporter (APC superfamily) [Mucilaginibacter yixingensis]|uniref:Amino acid/polyamine/organocation transporter (APC superfamily) n=1 Tax=Mucilaginibacter yixingensis TaxID=1295612 RepID=A0A2T5J6E2_9SPHI|nr:amino acid permease [Mucilaginibacter yixingensis]PTQ94069.1 amino acid/polyamine/organocation transporter (APC superfamily) [Mucilaginibacter yixingensis]
MQDNASPKLKHELGLLDGTMLVAGSMIGSGIFIVSADIIRNVGSSGWLIFVWVITGFMTLTAAVSYGELSGMYPKAGGQYVYLKEAYNKMIAFLYGWSFFAVIQTGTIAAVGVAFSKFAAYIFKPLSEDNILFSIATGTNKSGAPTYFTISAAQIVSILLIILLTYVNTKGVKGGKIIQNIFTLAKLLSLFGLIIFGLIMLKGDVWHANWSNAWSLHKLNADGSFSSYTTTAAMGAIAAAMVGSIFSADAWNNVTFIAGEMNNPKRNIGLSLFFGTLIVTIIYVSANVMYTAVLPLHDIATAEKDRVAVAASTQIFGQIGTLVIALMIMVSTFGCNNGLILAGARVYHTMANDGLFFKKAGTLNKAAVPEFGLWIQCVVASILCLSGSYGKLLDMISFVVVLFYVLTIFGIYILRKKRPDAERPYKAFGYPVLPAIYIIMGLVFCGLLLKYQQGNYPVWGLIIVLIGIPIYYFTKPDAKKQEVLTTDS